MERILTLLALSCSLVAAIHAAGALKTCARNYEKYGCFADTSDQSQSMLVYDRYNIQWKNIEAYMHSLACKCEIEARKNKEYVGFAIHFWGECYGKTQAQIDALKGKSPSKECTGDQTYKGCSAAAKECAGHAYTDYVYKLKQDISIPDDVEHGIQDCDDKGINITCAGGSKIQITKLGYGPRSANICGEPLTTSWQEKCSPIDSEGEYFLKDQCDRKSHCTIKGWKTNSLDACPKTLKYFDIKYKCKA